MFGKQNWAAKQLRNRARSLKSDLDRLRLRASARYKRLREAAARLKENAPGRIRPAGPTVVPSAFSVVRWYFRRAAGDFSPVDANVARLYVACGRIETNNLAHKDLPPLSRNRKLTMAKRSTSKNAKTETVNGKTQNFSFTAPTARSVQLVGDFTQWQQKPINMQKGADGIWRTTVELSRGAHHYRFLVDGQWRDDPVCIMRTPNPYGSQDAVREVA